MAREFINSKDNAVADLLRDQTTDGDSTDGYVDPRSQIVVSDDEPEDDEDGTTGPSGNGAGDFNSDKVIISFIFARLAPIICFVTTGLWTLVVIRSS